MRILKIILRILVFFLLTILTQIGGIVYIISFLSHKVIDKWTDNKYFKTTLRLTSFLIFYLTTTFLIVPLISKPFGRVPLPISETNHLRPLNILTCLLNRNYVSPILMETTLDVAQKMNDKFPGTTLNYLDANFPFINNFPLIPHLSHNDGKKLDLSFYYLDKITEEQTNESPSVIGYGICEEPLPNENNTSEFCADKGYWQYSFMTKLIPQGKKQDFRFDIVRTQALLNLLISQKTINKIFIEPHLKSRLKLTSDKVRFHGCQAVRHDDHIHFQL